MAAEVSKNRRNLPKYLTVVIAGVQSRSLTIGGLGGHFLVEAPIDSGQSCAELKVRPPWRLRIAKSGRRTATPIR
jgi:hypothetical protein